MVTKGREAESKRQGADWKRNKNVARALLHVTSLGLVSDSRFSQAANAARNGVAVGAGLRVIKESANLVGDFGVQTVLDFAGVFVQQRLVQSKGLEEQALSEAVAAHEIVSAPLAVIGQRQATVVEPQPALLRHHEKRRAVSRELGQSIRAHAGLAPRFLNLPDHSQETVDELFLLGGRRGDFGQPAMMQLDATLGHASDLGVVPYLEHGAA